MTWTGRLLRWLHIGRTDVEVERAEREQEVKDHELRVKKGEVRHAVNGFAAEVEAALKKRRET